MKKESPSGYWGVFSLLGDRWREENQVTAVDSGAGLWGRTLVPEQARSSCRMAALPAHWAACWEPLDEKETPPETPGLDSATSAATARTNESSCSEAQNCKLRSELSLHYHVQDFKTLQDWWFLNRRCLSVLTARKSLYPSKPCGFHSFYYYPR